MNYQNYKYYQVNIGQSEQDVKCSAIFMDKEGNLFYSNYEPIHNVFYKLYFIYVSDNKGKIVASNDPSIDCLRLPFTFIYHYIYEYNNKCKFDKVRLLQQAYYKQYKIKSILPKSESEFDLIINNGKICNVKDENISWRLFANNGSVEFDKKNPT